MDADNIAFQSSNVSLSFDMPVRAERRASQRALTILRVAKLITPLGEELCRIRNISAGGVMAETSARHAVGDFVEIELRADQRLAGSIVWADENSVGIQFSANVDVADVLARTAGHPRRHPRPPRIAATCAARLRIGAMMYDVPVTDISQGGMRVAIDDPACVGSPVVVTVDGLPSVEGNIRWVRDGQAGIAFKEFFPFDQLTRWLGMRLAGCRPASDGQQER